MTTIPDLGQAHETCVGVKPSEPINIFFMSGTVYTLFDP